jgi:ABC-type sulfate/molybdate transport systems ATPase subunit
LVRNPAAFLFDEPLSNLDAKLRQEMRVELKQLHQSLAATTIYVKPRTIKLEAMNWAAVRGMDRGRLQQSRNAGRNLRRSSKICSWRGFLARRRLICCRESWLEVGRKWSLSGWLVPMESRTGVV